MCSLNLGNVSPDDVSVQIKIRYLAQRKLLRRNDNISRGCATKMEFPEGRGGPFCEPILENPEERESWEKSFP